MRSNLERLRSSAGTAAPDRSAHSARPAAPVHHAVVLTLSMIVASAAQAQETSALARVGALGLDSMSASNITTYFAAADRDRAVQVMTLLESAAAHFERELGVTFDLRTAVLAPASWISYIPAAPAVIPWAAEADRLIIVPTSDAPLPGGFTGMIDFITLHEYGHLAANQYFLDASEGDYGTAYWFGEILATYFAYDHLRSRHPIRTDSALKDMAANLASFTPREVSLDWSFMRDLPPDELQRTYGWYQQMLNLKVADVHARYGLDFLRMVRERLPWEGRGSWTTTTMLSMLDEIAPGFQAWADGLPSRYENPGGR